MTIPKFIPAAAVLLAGALPIYALTAPEGAVPAEASAGRNLTRAERLSVDGEIRTTGELR